MRWRKAEDLPPEAHYGNKRSQTWTGYKVHVTETCDDDEIHVLTHVETTLAGITDSDLSATIHEALAYRALLTGEHFLDSGYVDADLLVTSQKELSIKVVGPVRPDSSWQAQAGQGYDVSLFQVDWQAQQVICPQGYTSYRFLGQPGDQCQIFAH